MNAKKINPVLAVVVVVAVLLVAAGVYLRYSTPRPQPGQDLIGVAQLEKLTPSQVRQAERTLTRRDTEGKGQAD